MNPPGIESETGYDQMSALLCEGVLRKLAHDLKSPLRTLRSYSEAIRDDASALLPDSSRFMLDTLVQTAEKIERRIDAITRLADALPTQTEQPLILLHDHIHLSTLEVAAESHQGTLVVNIDVDPSIAVRVNSNDLKWIISELLQNSTKFRRSDPANVRIRASMDSEGVSLTFSDDGIGVAPRHGERLFDLFYRNVRDEEFAGEGSGLTIARALSIRNHCKLRYLSGEENRGTTFELWIPRLTDAT